MIFRADSDVVHGLGNHCQMHATDNDPISRKEMMDRPTAACAPIDQLYVDRECWAPIQRGRLEEWRNLVHGGEEYGRYTYLG